MHPAILPIAGIVAIGGGIAAYLGLHKKPATPAPTNSGPAPLPAAKPASPAAAPAAAPAAPPVPQAAPSPPTPAPPAKSTDPTRATVTTSDPAPAGDLNVYAGPSNAKKIGGIDKNAVVEVITWNAGNAEGYDWALVRSSGGKNYPASVQGYVHRKFLKP